MDFVMVGAEIKLIWTSQKNRGAGVTVSQLDQ